MFLFCNEDKKRHYLIVKQLEIASNTIIISEFKCWIYFLNEKKDCKINH